MIIATEKMLDIKNYQNGRLAKLKRLMKMPKFKFISTALIIALSFFQYIFVPFYGDLFAVTNQDNSTAYFCSSFGLPYAFYIFSLSTYIIEGLTLPLIVLSVTSTIVVRVLFSSRQNLEQVMSFSRERRIRDRKFAITSVTLNVCFLVLKLPLVLAGFAYNVPSIDVYLLSYWLEIARTSFFVYSCLPFFINFITNSLFRSEFYKIIRQVLKLVRLRENNSVGVVQSSAMVALNTMRTGENNATVSNNQHFSSKIKPNTTTTTSIKTNVKTSRF
jgi:hypothetical protein